MPATKKDKGQGAGSLVTFYLLAYNTVQVIGWSHVFYETIRFLLWGKEGTLWEAVNPSLMIFQTGAVLEILNVGLGFVRSSMFTTLFQVASRVFIVWPVLYWLPPSQSSIGLPLLLFAWCITEIIRYSFYALGILNSIPYALVWCRYTFFYVLYPIGVTGELASLLSTMPYVRREKPLTIELPNALNFTFSLEYIFYFTLFLYVFIFPSLYKHMINQRKKTLGTNAESSSPKSSDSKKSK